jgi:CubicO group peptidase (beta-lactamase class C family)
MTRKVTDLESAGTRLGKSKHIDPAIILTKVSGTGSFETISVGPIDQRWEIGSITKVFTALLLAQLQTTNRLDLTAPIAQYLPDSLNLPASFDQITFEHLATHRSGLPRLPAGMKLLGKGATDDPYAIFNQDRIYQAIQETKLKRAPGTKGPKYSNYGAGLLGFILGLSQGKKYEELLQTEVLTPLGLASATFSDDELRVGHARKKEVGPWHLGELKGMGGLRMSPTDLDKFLAVSQDQNHELAQAFAETFKIRYQAKRSAIGLGWLFLKDNNIVGHNGGTLGARTEAFINLGTGARVVVCGDGNSGTFPVAIDLLS